MCATQLIECPRTSDTEVCCNVNQYLLRECIELREVYFDSVILYLYIRHIAVIGHVVGIGFREMVILAAKQSRERFDNLNGLRS